MTPEYKFRVYYCPVCRAYPCRPLHGEPKPCDLCLSPLGGLPYRVEDGMVYAETILAVARGDHAPDGYFPDQKPQPGE